jgi:arginine:ornithine antiporter / lysine permease
MLIVSPYCTGSPSLKATPSSNSSIFSGPFMRRQSPSMAAVLEHVVGHWRALLISVGLVISLARALLSWVLLCAEILFSVAKDRTMPAFLRKENANNVRANALWLTNAMSALRLR